jgi:FKBP-type peptidyl-prolyl cis-trans isomerase SlpA
MKTAPMTDITLPRVTATSFLTLHYRVATEDGMDLVSTFGNKPSTLQMGSGELAPPLEDCLIGLTDGDERSFTLDTHSAFGPRNPQFVQRIGRSDLPPGSQAELHGVIEIIEPTKMNEISGHKTGGRKIAGRVVALDDETVTLDFNHPLAGRSIRFDVHLLGVL